MGDSNDGINNKTCGRIVDFLNQPATTYIVVIMADDLGYGDVSCNGTSAVQTPNIDRVAAEGRRFSNGYCSASTCTPTGYSLLKQQGYATAVIGKWHLGLGVDKPDWNGALNPGPLEIGFDHCLLLPTTNDRLPQVFVNDHHVI